MKRSYGVTIGNLEGISDCRGQLPGKEDYQARPLSDLGPDGPLQWLVVHHTAGAERDFSAREIANYHVHTLGWPVPIAGHGDIALPGYGTACPGDTFLSGSRWKDWIVT